MVSFPEAIVLQKKKIFAFVKKKKWSDFSCFSLVNIGICTDCNETASDIKIFPSLMIIIKNLISFLDSINSGRRSVIIQLLLLFNFMFYIILH